jgi:hypothetical protein
VKRYGAAAILALSLSACTQTQYVEMPADARGEQTAHAIARTVHYRQDDLLLTQPPSCLLVVGNTGGSIAPELVAIIEQSLARHLAQRARRVLTGETRDREARRLGVTGLDPGNARYLAGRLGCEGVVEYDVANAEARYLLFYTRLAMTLDIRALRAADGLELWRARHATAKSSGGPPTSFAAVFSAWSATELAGDAEAVEGLVEEIVRRLMATWPVAKRPA